MPPNPVNFLFLVEMGFCHVGQAGLELLTSNDLSVSASQSPGITGVRHCAWPDTFFFTEHLLGTRNYAEAFIYITSLKPHSNPLEKGLL